MIKNDVNNKMSIVDIRQINDEYANLVETYRDQRSPIEVDFRKIAPIKYGERATHSIHPYPAKLLPHIPAFFCNVTALSEIGDTVYDPFCGSGTSLLEARMAGRNTIGADSNPLARLISRVKTNPVRASRLRLGVKQIREWLADGKKKEDLDPDVVNLNYWYSKTAISALSRLRSAIDRFRDPAMTDFFSVCLSVTARKVSYADPRVSVPVRLNPSRFKKNSDYRRTVDDRICWLDNVDVVSVFFDVANSNIERMEDLNNRLPLESKSDVRLHADARCGKSVTEGSVELVITSPPYLGAQKYIRSSSLSLGWLGFAGQGELRPLEVQNIGREHYHVTEYENLKETGISADRLIRKVSRNNPLRAHIAANYLIEMRQAIRAIKRTLSASGHLVLIAGPNRITGLPFPTPQYLQEILLNEGFHIELELVDKITSRGLMTRRNRTASTIESEWVCVYRKGEK